MTRPILKRRLRRVNKPRQTYSAERRIGACADYLLGRSLGEIELKWDVNPNWVLIWIKRAGSFKLRREGARSQHCARSEAS